MFAYCCICLYVPVVSINLCYCTSRFIWFYLFTTHFYRFFSRFYPLSIRLAVVSTRLSAVSTRFICLPVVSTRFYPFHISVITANEVGAVTLGFRGFTWFFWYILGLC